ncbi:MAG: GDP-mannose 4,6-dehydratase [Coprothermobacterota bacterium]|nr:GDP-mannose 4,6-dehydratase [Coprothermobacterota bacterium]
MAIVLVTGGAGFIGSHLVQALVRAGQGVRVLDDLSSGSLGNLREVQQSIEFLKGDIRHDGMLKAAIRGVEGIFHLAAISSVERGVKEPMLVQEVNVGGTLAVLEAARAAGVKRLVFVSSAAAYGDNPRIPLCEEEALRPLSPYGASKMAGEAYCGVYHHLGFLETVILRFFNIFGPRQDPSSPYSGVISLFCCNATRGLPSFLDGEGTATRDFLYVEDACRALLLAMGKEEAAGRILNVAGGQETSIRTLGETIYRLAGLPFQPVDRPPRLGDIRRSLADSRPAQALLGWEAKVSLEEGLGCTLDWMRAQP